MRLLLVEDTGTAARIMLRQLERLGLDRVDHAETAEQAQRRMRAEHYDLVLLDWVLPGMSGVDLLRWIRRFRPSRHTPVIMVTGKQQRDDVLTAFDAGANDFITKPPALDLLRRKVGMQLKEAAELFAREGGPEPVEAAY